MLRWTCDVGNHGMDVQCTCSSNEAMSLSSSQRAIREQYPQIQLIERRTFPYMPLFADVIFFTLLEINEQTSV